MKLADFGLPNIGSVGLNVQIETRLKHQIQQENH